MNLYSPFPGSQKEQIDSNVIKGYEFNMCAICEKSDNIYFACKNKNH